MVLTIHQNVGISFKLQFLLSIWVVLYEIRTNVVSFWKLYTFDFVALLTFALLACAFLKQLQLFYTCSFEVKCALPNNKFWWSYKQKILSSLGIFWSLMFSALCQTTLSHCCLICWNSSIVFQLCGFHHWFQMTKV